MKRPLNSAGFTLLEAIVALVIVGAVMIPMLSFIGLASRGLTTAAESNERSFAKQAAVAVMDPVNPLIEPQGQIDIDSDITLSWTSEPLIPPNTEMLMGGGLSGYQIGFYRVTVRLSRPDEDPWFVFEMRKIGYQSLAQMPGQGLQ